MARGKRRQREVRDPLDKLPHETDLMWRSRIAMIEQNERNRSLPLVPAEAEQHGDYKPLDNGARQNASASPLTRWRINKMLTDPQLAAIYHCIKLWGLVGLPEAKTTSAYQEAIRGNTTAIEDPEWKIVLINDAKDDLGRIQGYIPEHYWEIFENCIRFDEPAGLAGSRLGYGSRTAQARAHQVVCFVADTIAWKERIRY